jgi:hypothetical protein
MPRAMQRKRFVVLHVAIDFAANKAELLSRL